MREVWDVVIQTEYPIYTREATNILIKIVYSTYRRG